MNAIEIAKDVYWVGGIDWNLRNFHGYMTQEGSTYNAYLIIDKKVTLIDFVKSTVKDQLFERIKQIIDPKKIDILVCNHVEMDHSGALPDLMEMLPNATVVASPQGEKGLLAHYRKDWKVKVVKTGDHISLGKRTLQFINTPMVHWPDNMVSYCPEEKILFSNDSFGQHYATNEIFDVENPYDIIMKEAKKYYANIVLPYVNPVKKEYEALKGLDIKTIAPSHGVIWTKHVPDIVSNYVDWVSNKTRKKALIVYDTMWGSTEKIAFQSIAEAFEAKGYVIDIKNLQNDHISDVMTSFMDAEYIAVGSPTLNKNILPTVAAFLTYLKGLSPGGRKAIAFGSYGWGGESVKQIAEYFEQCKFDVIEQFNFKYVPFKDDLSDMCQQLKKII